MTTCEPYGLTFGCLRLFAGSYSNEI